MIDFLFSIVNNPVYRITLIMLLLVSLTLSLVQRLKKYKDNVYVKSFQLAVIIIVLFDVCMLTIQWLIK